MPDAAQPGACHPRGHRAARGPPAATMPGFADALTDAQVAALMTYVRRTFSRRPPWSGLEDKIREARRSSQAGHDGGAGTARDHWRSNDHAQRQRPTHQVDADPRDAAALRAARRPAAQRRQVRLRPGPVRRLHGAGRRQAGALVHDADRGRCEGAQGHDARRAGHAPTSPGRCSAPSSRSRRRNAAIASPA